MAEYVHHVPGRLRVKCSAVKGKADKACSVRQLVESKEGILGCEVNPLTGSILIRYDEGVHSAYGLLELLRQSGCVSAMLPVKLAAHRAADRRVSEVGKAVGKAVMGAVFDRMVERSAAALVGALL
jgi:hypothetical protein